VAVIDVGSHSVRLLVARGLSPVAFEVVDEERYDARLGQGQAGGELSPATMERGLKALHIISQIASTYGPESLVAVGTEALRRAPNAREFVERVRTETGVRVQVLSAVEEAFASFLGVVNSTCARDGYVVDIGGGSLELVEIDGSRAAAIQSAPLGALYATERFLQSDPPSAKDLRALRKAVRQQITVGRPAQRIYGVGGAIRNIARIVRLKRGYPLRRLHGLEIDRREIRRLATRLTAVSVDERRRIPGMNSSRADVLHAAAVVLDEVMHLTAAETLWVSGQGLREGLVWQELRPESPVIPDVRAASIAGLARANGVDELAAEPVVAAAAQLFEATGSLHQLDQNDLDVLLNGARLAGIGMHIDYYNRDRHAEYLVHSGDLHGFSHREIVLLGALVRWSDSGTPDLSPFASIIQPGDERRAAVLAALLGTARAARRRIPSPLRSLNVSLDGDGLCISLVGGGRLDAEVYELQRQQRRLEAVFATPVRIEAGS
jgi:exopolyphosphatase/guanosine-5'-triphosphate,3'-diphosphate pyrophosphatase